MYFERNKTYRNTFDYHVDASLSTSNTLTIKGSASGFKRSIETNQALFSGRQFSS
ncbi:MAG: hypothetical protein U0X71_01515 [Sphingobacteriaceae bacterium]|jgi:hypothetical protein